MSAFRLDPRRVDPDNWKQWHKDSLRLWWRLGIGRWMIATGVPILAMMGLVDRFSHLSWDVLLWGVPLLGMGYLLMPIQIAVLRQARRGGRQTFVEAWKQTCGNGISVLVWWTRRMVFGSLAVGGVWILVLGLAGLIYQQEATSEEGAIALLLLAHLTSYCWLVQSRGILDMGYFLEGQERLEKPLARGLNLLGQMRNSFALRQGMMVLLYGHMSLIFLAAMWRPFILFLPWLSWHSAGVLLNAWHDIFDPDGGLKAPQTVALATPSQASANIPARR